MKKKLFALAFLALAFTVGVSAQGNAVFKFKGKIGGQFPIVMELSATAGSAWGSYYYVSQGPKKKLDLDGEIDLDNESGTRWV